MTVLDLQDVHATAERITGRVRPVVLAGVDSGTFGAARVSLAWEYMQHTGSFKARGAVNLALAHLEAGGMPEAGIVIASGGNAGLACAWAAQDSGTKATVFLPATAPRNKIDRLGGYGADVRLVDGQYADALAASVAHAESTGALLSHAYDHPLIAAGAGTLALEILATQRVDTIMVAVGGGGLFAGVAAVAAAEGVRVVAVEPENCRALNAALGAGRPVDVEIDSIAADSLGARRTSAMALAAAGSDLVDSVLVPDEAIVAARKALWQDRRVAVEYGGATALAALMCGAYKPSPGESVAVVLCGANTDLASL